MSIRKSSMNFICLFSFLHYVRLGGESSESNTNKMSFIHKRIERKGGEVRDRGIRVGERVYVHSCMKYNPLNFFCSSPGRSTHQQTLRSSRDH